MSSTVQAANATPAAADPRARGRVSEIDTAKGIGIVLVVFGHMVARDIKPQGNDWWMVWHDHLYSFHMAFFFFLSGYVFFMQPSTRWVERLRKTAARLLPAYILFGLVVYLAKAGAVRLLHVDRPVQSPIDELWLQVVYPTQGFAQFLWFIVTLLMIMSIVALLRTVIDRHYWMVLGVSFALHLASVHGMVTEVLALQQLTRYALFFLLAALCHTHAAGWSTLTSRYGAITFAAFVAALTVLPEIWLATVAALLSVPALVALARWLERWPWASESLQYLGRNTLTIYLMNSLAMGLVRAIVLKYWGWDGWHFFVVVPLLLASGLLAPVIIQRLVFARWRWSDRITR